MLIRLRRGCESKSERTTEVLLAPSRARLSNLLIILQLHTTLAYLARHYCLSLSLYFYDYLADQRRAEADRQLCSSRPCALIMPWHDADACIRDLLITTTKRRGRDMNRGPISGDYDRRIYASGIIYSNNRSLQGTISPRASSIFAVDQPRFRINSRPRLHESHHPQQLSTAAFQRQKHTTHKRTSTVPSASTNHTVHQVLRHVPPQLQDRCRRRFDPPLGPGCAGFGTPLPRIGLLSECQLW